MKEIKEIEVEGKKVYLVKRGDNFKVVYPIKIDGKINWKNLIAGGSWWNLLLVALILFLLFGLANEYLSNLKIASACLRALPDYVNLQMYLDNPNLNSTFIMP